MKSTQKNVLIVAVIVVVILILIVLFYKSPSPVVAPTQDTNPVATTSEATSTDIIVSANGGIYTNKTFGYIVTYPAPLSFREGVMDPAAYGDQVKATVFDFPRAYYGEGTIALANISVAATNNSCSVSPDGQQQFMPGDSTVKNGVAWNITNINDAGAGNFYYIIEYSTAHNGLCYRVSSFVHEINPSPVYGDNQVKINAAIAANKAVESKIAKVLDTMVSSFRFTK